MCYIIYFDNWWYIWSLNSEQNSHTVLSNNKWYIQFCWIILLAKKADTIWYIIYRDNRWYIWSFKNEQSRHTVLAVSQIIVYYCCNIWTKKNRHYVMDSFMSWLAEIRSSQVNNSFTLCSLFNKNLFSNVAFIYQ